jgi:spore germination protein GerM
MTARRAPFLALLAVLLLVLTGCGIPQDSEPRLIAEEPVDLGTTTQPADNQVGEDTVTVFLITRRANAEPTLAGRPRTTALQPGPLEAVDRLLDGLTEEDKEKEYTTAVPDGTRRLPGSSVDPATSTIVLDLSNEFSNVSGPLQLQAYAQLVFTATQYDRSAPVRFRIDGEPTSAPTDEGQLPVVHRSNYRDLSPQ